MMRLMILLLPLLLALALLVKAENLEIGVQDFSLDGSGDDMNENADEGWAGALIKNEDVIVGIVGRMILVVRGWIVDSQMGECSHGQQLEMAP